MHTKTVSRVLWIISPAVLLRALGTDVFLTCIPSVAETFEASFAVTQWVLTVYLIGSGLGQIFMGPLTDKYGRRIVLLASAWLFFISSLACALVPSLNMLIFFRLLQGIGACGTTVATVAVIRDLYDDHTISRVYSYLNSIIAIAPLCSPLVGGLLLVWTGTWRSTFYFLAVFSFIAIIVSYCFLKETNPYFNKNSKVPRIGLIKGYTEILTNKSFYIYMICSLTGLSGLFLFFSMSSILLIKIIGIRPDIYGFYFGLNAIIYLLGNMVSPKLQLKFGDDKVIVFGIYITIFGALIMYLLDSLFGLSTLGFMLPNAIITLGIGLLFGPAMAGSLRPFKHIAGMASASYGAVLYCITGIVVSGVMQFEIIDDKPLAIAMIIMSILSLIALKMLPKSKYQHKTSYTA